MAHRGHQYPLTFRRDFNINVSTYQGGLAETYLLKCPPFTFTDWPALRPIYWYCGPATDLVLPKLIWASPLHTVSGHNWRFRIIGTLTGVSLELWEPSWILERDGTDVCGWQMAAASGTASFPPNGIRGRLLFYDPAVFPSGPGSIGFVEVSPVGYT